MGFVLLATLSPTWAVAAVRPGDSPRSERLHRYVVYLTGINSTGAEAVADLAPIDAVLRQPPPRGLGEIPPEVFFSYAAATAAKRGESRCVGWGAEACDEGGNLRSLHLQPVFSSSDTRVVSPDEHAAALGWLLEQIVRLDEQAEIDLVGYSLGGIVATRWAALNGSTEGAAGRVRAIVMLESSVGGVPDLRSPATAPLVELMFGTEILTALKSPDDPSCASSPDLFVCALRRAANSYPVTSIESLEDYFVNGQPISVEGIGPRRVGIGAAGWPAQGLTLHEEHLGGSLAAGPLDLLAATELVFANHRAPLTAPRTADLVVQALGEPAAPGCRFVLGFQALHDLIPDVVGDCLEDEHFDLASGNTIQTTTNGLLVYRAADNWTAFTDGATTWINGPFGLQSRPNDARFEWESP